MICARWCSGTLSAVTYPKRCLLGRGGGGNDEDDLLGAGCREVHGRVYRGNAVVGAVEAGGLDVDEVVLPIDLHRS